MESKPDADTDPQLAEQVSMRRRPGFTLVELVIAMSLLTILLGGLFFALGHGLRIWRKVAREVDRQQISNLVAERICRDIRAAGEILPSSSSEEVVLKIGSEVISYKLVNSKVRRKKGSSVAYLTSEKEVGALSFSFPAAVMVGISVGGFSTHVSIRN